MHQRIIAVRLDNFGVARQQRRVDLHGGKAGPDAADDLAHRQHPAWHVTPRRERGTRQDETREPVAAGRQTLDRIQRGNRATHAVAHQEQGHVVVCRDAEQSLGVEQVVVEAIDTCALAGRVPVAAQIDGEQFDARRVQPLGERRVTAGVFGEAVQQCDPRPPATGGRPPVQRQFDSVTGHDDRERRAAVSRVAVPRVTVPFWDACSDPWVRASVVVLGSLHVRRRCGFDWPDHSRTQVTRASVACGGTPLIPLGYEKIEIDY